MLTVLGPRYDFRSSFPYERVQSLTISQWQGRNATRLADYTGFIDASKTTPASITDAMPVMALADTEPIVKDYMDTQAGPLCYTYSSM